MFPPFWGKDDKSSNIRYSIFCFLLFPIIDTCFLSCCPNRNSRDWGSMLSCCKGLGVSWLPMVRSKQGYRHFVDNDTDGDVSGKEAFGRGSCQPYQ